MIDNSEISIRNPFRVMDEALDSMDSMDNRWLQIFNLPNSMFKKFVDNGVSVISRPHNIISIKDKDGKVIGNKLEVVTTPFKKDEVSVEISNGVLTVTCEKADPKVNNEEISAFEYDIHHGISSQSYRFTIKLSDRVNVDGITAKNEDGILTITMPLLKEVKNDEVRKITIL